MLHPAGCGDAHNGAAVQEGGQPGRRARRARRVRGLAVDPRDLRADAPGRRVDGLGHGLPGVARRQPSSAGAPAVARTIGLSERRNHEATRKEATTM